MRWSMLVLLLSGCVEMPRPVCPPCPPCEGKPDAALPPDLTSPPDLYCVADVGRSCVDAPCCAGLSCVGGACAAVPVRSEKGPFR